MQSVSSVSISYDDNHYTTGTFNPIYHHIWDTVKKVTNKISCNSKDKLKAKIGRIDTAIWMHDLVANKMAGEKNQTAITQELCEQYE